MKRKKLKIIIALILALSLSMLSFTAFAANEEVTEDKTQTEESDVAVTGPLSFTVYLDGYVAWSCNMPFSGTITINDSSDGTVLGTYTSYGEAGGMIELFGQLAFWYKASYSGSIGGIPVVVTGQDI
jgi:hypothetical protein